MLSLAAIHRGESEGLCLLFNILVDRLVKAIGTDVGVSMGG